MASGPPPPNDRRAPVVPDSGVLDTKEKIAARLRQEAEYFSDTLRFIAAAVDALK